jgi:hypothetical protein
MPCWIKGWCDDFTGCRSTAFIRLEDWGRILNIKYPMDHALITTSSALSILETVRFKSISFRSFIDSSIFKASGCPSESQNPINVSYRSFQFKKMAISKWKPEAISKTWIKFEGKTRSSEKAESARVLWRMSKYILSCFAT